MLLMKVLIVCFSTALAGLMEGYLSNCISVVFSELLAMLIFFFFFFLLHKIPLERRAVFSFKESDIV